jgi:hypothetical protein
MTLFHLQKRNLHCSYTAVNSRRICKDKPPFLVASFGFLIYLVKKTFLPASIPSTTLEVHLPPLSLSHTHRNNLHRTTPVIGLLRPKVHLAGIDTRSGRVEAIHKAIKWLNVERRLRYSPAAGKTYCNIYAYDLAYLLGAYIPRVWWRPEALNKILRGERVDVVYAETVTELNSNALADWLLQYGTLFSWKRFSDLTEMQKTVNEGRLGFIVAQPKEENRLGHITAVVPETGSLIANRNKTVVISPLQSQAGAQNTRYFCDTTWWVDVGKFRSFYFWVWEI